MAAAGRVKSEHSWLKTAAAAVHDQRRGGRGIPGLMSLDAIRQFVARTLDEWRTIRLADLQFWHRGEGQLAIISVFALIVLLLIVRSALSRRPGRHRLVVPALLGVDARLAAVAGCGTCRCCCFSPGFPSSRWRWPIRSRRSSRAT